MGISTRRYLEDTATPPSMLRRSPTRAGSQIVRQHTQVHLPRQQRRYKNRGHSAARTHSTGYSVSVI